jgi:hypothetical protein
MMVLPHHRKRNKRRDQLCYVGRHVIVMMRCSAGLGTWLCAYSRVMLFEDGGALCSLQVRLVN